MSWTYDTSLLPTSALMQVRFLVQDTDDNDRLVEDEEISFVLSQTGNDIYRAAYNLCNAIALKLGRELDVKGEIGFSSREKYEHYKELAMELKELSTTQGGAIEIFAGGISESEKDNYRADTDLTQPFFTRELHHYPGTNKLTNEDFDD